MLLKQPYLLEKLILESKLLGLFFYEAWTTRICKKCLSKFHCTYAPFNFTNQYLEMYLIKIAPIIFFRNWRDEFVDELQCLCLYGQFCTQHINKWEEMSLQCNHKLMEVYVPVLLVELARLISRHTGKSSVVL